MTVKELIVELSKLPQDFNIVLQKDLEGNGYSPLSGLEPCYYEPYNTWSGEVPLPEDQEEPDNAVVIWPVN